MDQVLKVTFPGGKRVTADYKGFTIPTDQPVYSGGEGSAPAPFDLFLASIATCAGIYVLSFCASRGISVGDASVLMTPRRNEETNLIESIAIQVQLPPDFPGKYTRAVIKAVDQCAVKRHLQSPPKFEVTTVIQD